MKTKSKFNKAFSLFCLIIISFSFLSVHSTTASAQMDVHFAKLVAESDNVTICVKEVKNATKYIFYRKAPKSKQWKKLKETKKVKFVDYSAQSNKNYQYKVVAYKHDKILGVSKIEKIKTKKWKFTALVKQTAKEINEFRKKKGKKPLKLNANLCKGAEVRAKDCIKYFEHKRPDGSEPWPVYYRYLKTPIITSENLVSLEGRATVLNTAKTAVEGWIVSKPHREGMLRDTDKYIGIAFARDGEDVYAVSVFK